MCCNRRRKVKTSILFVDDEQNVLDAIKRQLRKKFNIITALDGTEALETVKREGPFAVVVSDMRMPVMDGIEFLSRVREIVPDTVRMMLTGNADQETAIEAVNRGSIFRFLTKPCSVELLENSLNAGIEQYRLITAEKELLSKTLNGTIKVLTEILSLVNPAAFSRAYRIKNIVREIAVKLKLPNLWQYQIAALLSQIGCITLPSDTIEKMYAGVKLTDDEEKMYQAHPEAGAKLLANIPRLGIVSRIIEAQQQPNFKLKGIPESPYDKAVAIGAQILHLAIDYDQLIFLGASHDRACKELAGSGNLYNPNILAALLEITPPDMAQVIRKVGVMELEKGMMVNQDVLARNGLLIAAKGQKISMTAMQRLRNFSNTIGVEEPIEVIVFQQEKRKETEPSLCKSNPRSVLKS